MRERQIPARWLAVLAATAIGIYLCWLMLQPFVEVLEWAAVLVIVFYPVNQRLSRWTGHPKLSALASALLIIVIVLAPLLLLMFALGNELRNVAQSLPENLTAFFDSKSPAKGRIVAWIQQHVHLDSLQSQEFIKDQLGQMSAKLLGQSLGLIGGMIAGFFKTFFVIFTTYYLFRDGDKIVSALPDAFPLSRHQSEGIIARTKQVIAASVYGVICIAMIQGILGGLAFWILGVPSPLLWAVLMTFVCLIPVAGSFLVWLPASAYLFFTGHWTKALLMVLWGTFIVSTVDNFLRPRLIRGQTKLHELFVFFSVLGGMRVFGLLGIVLGPVVLAITLALLETFKHGENGGLVMNE